ncbi:MAG: threonine synthase, partial [Candidatus Cloacimonetes bacterium]|nr:threonine synthase [Candidatus Cloacimonadota bacterium]
MLYYSTNLKARKVNFREALLQGLAEDKGLYMPEVFPTISSEEISSLRKMKYPEIAYTIGRKFLYEEIPDADFKRLVDDAYDYAVPLEKVVDNRYLMRLDQGPTASFKDFAARLMGRLMQYYLSLENRKLLILTATSGDTGSAIANAFYGLDNIQVVVLFPEKEVTPRQRKQMTTLGKNICVISIDGKFDDCQALVKRAFIDPDLSHLDMSSANSINIGRLIPQTMYYFYAYSQLTQIDGEDVVFSVPSGNFGDLMGGLIAKKMGLPVCRFVVATNENDEFPEFLKTGEYHVISPSKNCISSAMNVGHPSNVARLIAMYDGVMDETGKIHKMPDLNKIKQDMYSISITDKETEKTIEETYKQYGALLEPHGAVGWAGLNHYLADNPSEKQ